ncbi:MgtC/SapB family protein [Acidobacteria bacterium AH-259-O06]|nr:MgtC/SapB family protein [Acidobacteria bacterium AH-259-O06]
MIGDIGFLGAGTIIRARGTVEGITTAATIWVVGAIGVACGGGYYQIALITAVFAWLILTVVRLLEMDREELTVAQTTSSALNGSRIPGASSTYRAQDRSSRWRLIPYRFSEFPWAK